MKQFQKRITLNVTDELYASLLYEADSDPGQIPEVIRQKLQASYLSRDDAKIIRSQMGLLLVLVQEVLLDQVPVKVRMKKTLERMKPEESKDELTLNEAALLEKMERIRKLQRDFGLL